MNILIDIGHPAHVHLYRNFIAEMERRGHRLWVTVKNISSSKELLQLYRIPFIEIGEKSDSLFGKAVSQFKYNARIRKLVNENAIDIGIGSSITIAHVSKLTSMRSVVFDDDDDYMEPLFAWFAHPFINYLLSPDVLRGKRRKKSTQYYPGYHELAYLHPNLFTPDPSLLTEIGVKPGERFFVLRFNAFKAHHDVGAAGFSLENKRRLVSSLSRHGRVFITMERELESEFEPYRLKVSPDKIHSLLHYATLFIGDSQTMTSEAAILGTPALKCNTFADQLAVPNELQNRYQLCISYNPVNVELLFHDIDKLLARCKLKETWRERRERMLNDKIDLSAFMVWFIENLPDAPCVLKQNPNYFIKFR